MIEKQKIKEIYDLLPKLNCGFCGFENCGQFARAVAERRASPFGCRQNPRIGYRISEIIGVKAPAFSYGFYQSTKAPVSSAVLKEEVKELSQKVDDVLARIEKLRKR